MRIGATNRTRGYMNYEDLARVYLVSDLHLFEHSRVFMDDYRTAGKVESGQVKGTEAELRLGIGTFNCLKHWTHLATTIP